MRNCPASRRETMAKRSDDRLSTELQLDVCEDLLTGEEKREEDWWQQECRRRVQQLRLHERQFQDRQRRQTRKMADLGRRWRELEQRRAMREEEFISRCVTRMSSRQNSFLDASHPATSLKACRDACTSTVP